MTDERMGPLDRTYDRLVALWTSGVRDYHSMLSDYLMANSIFVAVLGLLISRESLPVPLMILILLLCIMGLLLCVQMAIVLGRFSGQNALWEWQLRGIEQSPDWPDQKILTTLHRLHYHLHETQAGLEDLRNEPTVFQPNWAFRRHRRCWAQRAISFPIFFGCVYGLLFFWASTQLWRQVAGGI